MYEHVRTVVWGLILSVIFIVGTGVVALIDPFNNGVPWINWLTMSIAVILSVVTSTIIAVTFDDSEGDFWITLGTACVAWLVGGGMTIGIVSSGIDSKYHALLATAFAIPFAVMPLAALVQYIVEATSQQQGSRSANIRRIA